MSVRNLTKKLPYPAKQLLKYAYRAIPLSIRYGKVFWDTYKFLQESQWWSREKLEEYQMQQLEKLLANSYENAPYYRRIFNEKGLKPKDIKSIDDLRKLPYLTKDIVRENLAELIAQNYPKSKLFYRTTGGSTGIPLGLYWQKGITGPKERAFVLRGWNWAGFKHGERSVILRGNVINRFKDGKRCWWEYDQEDNALILSSYDMTDENLPKYIQKIDKFRPVAIQGLPSSLYILANFLKKSNLRIKNIKCILTSSETLYPHQREMIEGYLGAKIYDHYGNTEQNALVMQCENEQYHIISEYGILELIGKNGDPVNKEGEVGEIVATGFNNYVMPFIRYRTGDIASYNDGKCKCGRNYYLLKRIEGRVQNFLVSNKGHLVPFAEYASILRVSKYIEYFQYNQTEKGYVTLNLVKKKGYTDDDSQKILIALDKIYGNGFNFKIEFVDDIARTKHGKYNYLIQKLPISFGNDKSE